MFPNHGFLSSVLIQFFKKLTTSVFLGIELNLYSLNLDVCFPLEQALDLDDS